MTIWVEPGEVSYRMSEKSPVKLLYQENEQTGVAAKRVQSLNASEQACRDVKLNASTNNLIKNSNDLMYNYNTNSNTSTATSNLNNATNEQDLTTSTSTAVATNGSPGNSSSSSNHSSTSSSVDSGFNDVEQLQAQQRKVVRSFNPEAQCFKPIESSSLLNSFNNQNTNQFSTGGNSGVNSMLTNNYSFTIQNSNNSGNNLNALPFSQAASSNFTNSNASSYFNQTATASQTTNVLKSPSNTNNILPSTGFAKQNQTMTTAQFAQTKVIIVIRLFFLQIIFTFFFFFMFAVRLN